MRSVCLVALLKAAASAAVPRRLVVGAAAPAALGGICGAAASAAPPAALGGIGGGVNLAAAPRPGGPGDTIFPASLLGLWECERRVTSVDGDSGQARVVWKALGG